jgi:hypothetical protein
MKTFKNFLTEEKNTHMTHLEDAVIYGGVKGTREAINALRAMRDMLAGSAKSGRDVTVKWDGAPAVFAGIDPRDGEFFVAKKGLFNKNPMVYKSHADVDADISNPDLANKMKVAYTELKKLGIKGIVQGDIMFTQDDLKTMSHDGKKYISFHPNTIVYAVEDGTDAAKEIKKAKIGVVWHTTYRGSDFASLSADYGVNVKAFKNVASVWSQDAELQDMSGKATLTASETMEVNKHLTNAGKLFNKIASSTLKTLESNRSLAETIETYNNTFVRAGTVIKDPKKHVDGLIKFIEGRFQKEIDKRKSEKGKQAQVDKRDQVMTFFSKENKRSLVILFELQLAIVSAKLLIIAKLSELNDINTFIKKANGYEVTGAEGFVAIDRLAGTALKLVDRMEFSTNNFSDQTIKGWQRV